MNAPLRVVAVIAMALPIGPGCVGTSNRSGVATGGKYTFEVPPHAGSELSHSMDPVDVSVRFVVDEAPTRGLLGDQHSEVVLTVHESMPAFLESASRFRSSEHSVIAERRAEEPSSNSLVAKVLLGQGIRSSSGSSDVVAASEESIGVRVQVESPVHGLLVDRTVEVSPSEFSERHEVAASRRTAAIAESIASLVVETLHEAVPVSGGVRFEDHEGVRFLTMDRGRAHGVKPDDLVLLWIRDGDETLGLAYCQCDPDDQTSTLSVVACRESRSEPVRPNADARAVIAALTDMERRASAADRRKAAQEFSAASLGAAAFMMAASQREEVSDEDRSALMAVGLLAGFAAALVGAQGGSDDVGALPSAPTVEMLGTVLRIEDDRLAKPLAVSGSPPPS